MVINSSGTVRDKHKYQAFGGSDGSSVGLGQAYRYTGKPLDEELGLGWYYYGARYYDPSIGRFPSIDPLHGKSPGWSPYAYCLNNPLRLVDPDGRAGCPNRLRWDQILHHRPDLNTLVLRKDNPANPCCHAESCLRGGIRSHPPSARQDLTQHYTPTNGTGL